MTLCPHSVMRLQQFGVVALVATILVGCVGLHAGQIADLAGVEVIDLGGLAVRVQTLGLESRAAGSPVVVFEAGATNSLEIWSDVLPQVADFAPVVAYDRAGLGQSVWDG